MSYKIDISFIESLFPMDKRKAAIDFFNAEVLRQAKILQEHIKMNSKDLSGINHAQAVLQVVADTLNINMYALQGKSRVRELTEARQIYAYIIRHISHVNISLKLAGDIINRDHATIIYHAQAAANLMRVNKPFAQKTNNCVKSFTEKFYEQEFNNIPQY